ncbi:hypothetical protein BCV69DRAFT_279882 [Microstroma glucosiphilum]|uniref:PIN domain-like protein n=1 Tax=Pseudomicrostroma glucosiphilum TaxID=1684307 RepID=A0A316UL96_9BASI|nr:hypothetical protein BCV69DRAFT_279882 [Pseudomicrostroma glucosiphilum]PWN23975.1 hypothetical protein BCV69DRAFT_279882 [Pseudomicrostroma glucosiphilum]
MGVRGLATLAKSYQAAISEVLEFPVAAASSSQRKTTTLSIDAWAWVFEVWASHFGESVQGGNYADLIEFVKDAVTAWRACSLEPVFIWDGPVPLIKQSQYLDRRASIAAGNSAFMRSSQASRSSKRFQLESYPFVPLLAQAVKAALADEGVTSVIAQAEADGAVAELADESGGLAASQDSDFFILCSRGSGRGRYTQIDSWEYMVEDKESSNGHSSVIEAPSSGSVGDSDGFEAVTSKRRRNRSKGSIDASSNQRGSGAQSLPYPPVRGPESESKLIGVKLRVFYPQKLAAQLRVPAALLPLLGAVAGNDYTTALQDTVLFRHLQTGPERIKEAAEVIQREWIRTIGGPGAGKQVKRATVSSSRSLEARLAAKSLMGAVREMDDDARSEYSDASSATATPAQMAASNSSLSNAPAPPLDPVRYLVGAVVSSLLERADVATHRSFYVSETDKEACIESIIESMAAYSLLTNVSASQLDDPAGFWSRVLPGEENRRALQRYRDAFEAGAFSEQMVSAMASRMVATTLAPEDPDQRSIHVGATRSIRRWIYAIIFGVWGMDWARETMADPTADLNGSEGEGEGSRTAPTPYLRSNGPYKAGERPDDVISVDTESESESEGENVERAGPSAPGSVFNGEDDDGDRDTYAPPFVKPPPAVKEFVRKGDRFVGDLVEIVKLADLLAQDVESLPPALAEVHAQYLAARTEAKPSHASAPEPTSDPLPALAPLLPSRTRLDVYRHALQSAGEAMNTVPLSVLPLAASLKHIIGTLAAEAGESKKRLNWTLVEVTSAVLAGCHVAAVHSARQGRSGTKTELLPRSFWVQPTSRAIHVASTLQLTLETADSLASALLLNTSPSPGDDIALPPPHVLFDGPIFHLLVANEGRRTKEMNISDETQNLAEQVLQAILANGAKEDLAISAEELKRLRKENKKKAKASAESEQGGLHPAAVSNGKKTKSSTQGSQNTGKSGKNAFELLMG